MKILSLLFAFGLLTLPSITFAQADRIGSGGNWNEGDLKHFLARLGTYLASEDGKKTFPEIVTYNAEHPEETAEKIAFALNPRLVSEKVHDSNGNERDCISYVKPIRYFECTLPNLPPKPDETAANETKSEFYGSLYRLVFHELLVQAGLEKPVSREIPSEYPISSRLMVHLENFPEWVPGSGNSGVYSENEVVVHTHLISSGALNFGKGFQNDGILTGVDFRLEAPVSFGSANFRFGVDASYEYALDGTHAWIATLLAVTQYDLPKISIFHPYLRFGMGLGVFRDRFTYWTRDKSGTTQMVQYYDNSSNAILSLVGGTRFGTKEKYFADWTFGAIDSFYHEYTAKMNLGIQF